jgi:hypothetical protein
MQTKEFNPKLMPPVIGWQVPEDALFGSQTFNPDGTPINGIDPSAPVAVFDGRRFERG